MFQALRARSSGPRVGISDSGKIVVGNNDLVHRNCFNSRVGSKNGLGAMNRLRSEREPLSTNAIKKSSGVATIGKASPASGDAKLIYSVLSLFVLAQTLEI
jgi:hypothetical protein